MIHVNPTWKDLHLKILLKQHNLKDKTKYLTLLAKKYWKLACIEKDTNTFMCVLSYVCTLCVYLVKFINS